MINYKAILLSDKVFICDERTNGYSCIDLGSMYFFDGEKATATHKKGWYELKSLPQKVEREIKEENKIIGYKLKNGFLPSEKLAEKVGADFFTWDTTEEEYDNFEIKELYEPIVETIPSRRIQENFEINLIATKNSNWNFVAPPKNVQSFTLDEILTHPDLLQDTSCYINPLDAYKLIREHVKSNINGEYACVSSDYDFHFAVSKKIKLAEKQEYKRNVNALRKARPKYVTEFREKRSFVVFDLVPSAKETRWGTNLPPRFEGKNYEDLEKVKNEYLNDLMLFINAPLKDCSHCKGFGVIKEDFTS